MNLIRHCNRHPSKIAFAIALVALSFALRTQAAESVKGPLVLAADTTAQQNSGNSQPLVDAPLSRLGPPGGSPATKPAPSGFHSDQAGPLESTPFSAGGSGTIGNDGSDADRSFSPADKSGAVPNPGR